MFVLQANISKAVIAFTKAVVKMTKYRNNVFQQLSKYKGKIYTMTT